MLYFDMHLCMSIAVVLVVNMNLKMFPRILRGLNTSLYNDRDY